MATSLTRSLRAGWDKACKKVDVKVAQAASGMFRPLTSSNVESHLKNVGLDAEFATHHRISALSGGQKVKVVLGIMTVSESAQISTRDHPSPPLLETSRVDSIKTRLDARRCRDVDATSLSDPRRADELLG